jgi:cell wall-associated NlpC family hydrolase
MRRVYAVAISLALLMGAPGLATADTPAGPAARQQAIKDVIARALTQRGVPYAYGGGNVSGPTASAVPAPIPGATADAAIIPDPNGAQLANVPVGGAPIAGIPAAASPALGSAAVTTPTAVAPPGVVGFDASGLIQYAFAGVGIKMPRSSGEMYKVGRKVLPSEALPGDLMFFGPDGTQSVALFVGNGQMLEATNPAVVVSPVRTTNMAPYLSRIIEW